MFSMINIILTHISTGTQDNGLRAYKNHFVETNLSVHNLISDSSRTPILVFLAIGFFTMRGEWLQFVEIHTKYRHKYTNTCQSHTGDRTKIGKTNQNILKVWLLLNVCMCVRVCIGYMKVFFLEEREKFIYCTEKAISLNQLFISLK